MDDILPGRRWAWREPELGGPAARGAAIRSKDPVRSRCREPRRGPRRCGLAQRRRHRACVSASVDFIEILWMRGAGRVWGSSLACIHTEGLGGRPPRLLSPSRSEHALSPYHFPSYSGDFGRRAFCLSQQPPVRKWQTNFCLFGVFGNRSSDVFFLGTLGRPAHTNTHTACFGSFRSFGCAKVPKGCGGGAARFSPCASRWMRRG